MSYRILVLICLISYTTQIRGDEAETTPGTVAAEVENGTDLPIMERSSHVVESKPTFKGFWRKNFSWRPRWVKTWQARKVYVAVWKRMWGPMMTKEFVPVPKPPPGWVKHAASAHAIKVHPH